ncbi:MAG: arginine--tRNA ligase, partial [Acholeplasmataceae bacterium]|nr:arginine--tRNA ligase [Acholeplasmataceae bacterium]
MLEQIKIQLKNDILNNIFYEVDVEVPRRGNFDLAIPLFRLRKETELDLQVISRQIEDVIINHPMVEYTELLGAFLNIKINQEKFSKQVLEEVHSKQSSFGSEEKKDETIVIDYSSPNIAKNFSVGHLRSTVIGHSLKLIHQKLGYTVYGINHLGDW